MLGRVLDDIVLARQDLASDRWILGGKDDGVFHFRFTPSSG